MAVDHYENFPVGSLLLPKRLRPAVHTIYAFARSADDIADEGDARPEERIAGLRRYQEDLDRIADGQTASHPILRNLADTIHRHNLPLQPFCDLLSAFTQDVTTKRYDDFDALRDYCRRSADPVGTLMLHLYGAATRENLLASGCICTALQLINFLQDVAIDWAKDRIYIPLEDMRQFDVSEQHIAEAIVDARWRALMRFEVERSRALMLTGAPLACRLPGRIGWELRLIVQGGLRILKRIEAANYDIFRKRPVLGPRDWLAVGRQAMVMRLAMR